MRPLACLILPVGLALVVLTSSGCEPSRTFRCKSNDHCVTNDGIQGICESNTLCSFPDESCPPSRRRYAMGTTLLGNCVPAGQGCVQQLSLGAAHSCALRSDGAVLCWGDNTDGKLGDGTTTDRPVPTAVVGLPRPAVSIGAAEYHTCAVLDDDSVWCWGANAAYELGTGSNVVAHSATPVRVMTAASLPDGGQTTPVPFSARSIATGGAHTCAVSEGKSYCWGENQSGGNGGQCGVDPALADDVALAKQVQGLDGVIEVSTGDEFTCARKDDSSVWCWGVNGNGELGNGTRKDSFLPVGNGLSSVKAIAAGDEHICALKGDLSVWCWGYGGAGSIGKGTFDDQITPVRVTSGSGVFSGGTTFVTCAIDAAGALSCWGANTTRQTGTASTADNVTTPTLSTLITVHLAALGAGHGCATTLDGALWCWGNNDHGQLGIGSIGQVQKVAGRVSFTCPQ